MFWLRLLSGLFALGLIVVSINYFSTSDKSIEIAQAQENYDAYMRHVTFYRYDEKGVRREKITTKLAKHYAKNNRVEYTAPVVESHDQDDNWKVSADKGESHHGATAIKLIDHVHLVGKLGKQQRPIDAKTSVLTVLPHQRKVLSSAKVVIKQPGVTVQGVGLMGDLTTGDMKLLRDTETLLTR